MDGKVSLMQLCTSPFFFKRRGEIYSFKLLVLIISTEF
uniref:Uncharacterized protein n=1 Tax=Rhizophora mucronata TaxID=61149 RepID=A0A2P2QRI5_RHIMU